MSEDYGGVQILGFLTFYGDVKKLEVQILGQVEIYNDKYM